MWIGTLAILAMTCCSPPAQTPLEKTSSRLKQGMIQKEVDSLFYRFAPSRKDFKAVVGPLGAADRSVFYRTNAQRGTVVTYWPKSMGVFDSFECCRVHFDTNGVILGYQYSKDK